MALVRLTCPHCQLSKELQEGLLPAAGTTVTCPRCRGTFSLPDTLEAAGTDADAAILSAASPALASAAVIPTDGAPPAPAHHETDSSPGSCGSSGDTPDCNASEALPGVPPLPPTPSPCPGQPGEACRTLTFAFAGDAKTYFGIWIVNTLLRIVTLGIYSPWAKVRKRRYFCGNTLLDDAPFDYLADPIAILKGWLIAGIFLGGYSLASRTSPILSSVLFIMMYAAYPWVMVRARMFSLRNTSHRNIRFSFKPNYREAYMVYLWLPMLIPFTLGILAPHVVYRQKRFQVENSSYGTTPFRFEATAKQYYRIFYPFLAIVPLALAAAGALFYLTKGRQPTDILFALLPFLLIVVVYVAVAVYLPTEISNLTWNSTSIGEHNFDSRLRTTELAWIYFSNAIAVIFSLGLLTPWATVRLARYRLEKLRIYGAGAFDSIAASSEAAMGATGEELGDMLGFDFGL